MTRWILAAFLFVGGAGPKPVVASGVVSDESCGAVHLKAGNEQCVVKCLRGGASVGHPEWKPQRMVLVAPDGRSTFVANPELLVDHAGRQVKVRATPPDKTNTVRVLSLIAK